MQKLFATRLLNFAANFGVYKRSTFENETVAEIAVKMFKAEIQQAGRLWVI